MTNETSTYGLRPFGLGEKIKADDYAEGETVTIKIKSFNGAETVEGRKGKIDILPIYGVEVNNQRRTWTVTTFCQKKAKELGIKDYPDIVGKVITAKIKHYGIGNGFVITAIK